MATIPTAVPRFLPGRLLLWWGGLPLAFWTVLGLFEGAQNWFLFNLYKRDDVTPWQCVQLSLATWYGLGLLAPAMWWLARNFSLEQHHWGRPLTVLLLASVGLSLLKVALDIPCERLIRPHWGPFETRSDLELFQIFFGARFVFYLLVFWLVIGLGQRLGQPSITGHREREARRRNWKPSWRWAQLQMLKMQLQPHFLFNTLNAISALIHQDVDLADRMIARLGELLRSTLDTVGTQEVTLRQELEFIEPYLEIEQARLGPRLSVQFDIDAEAMDGCVPNLILQPLVENAIRHGVAARGAGRVASRSRPGANRMGCTCGCATMGWAWRRITLRGWASRTRKRGCNSCTAAPNTSRWPINRRAVWW